MKKKYLIISGFFLLLLITVVTSEVLATRDFEVDINQTSRDALIEEGIINPKYTDYICKGEECTYRMYQINLTDNSTYNLGEHDLPRYKCTEFNETGCATYENNTLDELNVLQESQSEKWLEEFGYHLDNEKTEPVDTVIPNHGRITINERPR